MTDGDDSSPIRMLETECVKLEAMLEKTGPRSPIPEIIGLYHQVMTVSSLSAAIAKAAPASGSAEGVRRAGQLVSERFDGAMHPDILKGLSESVEELKGTLQSKASDAEPDAQMYDELRQMMSTLEFVRQYGDRLADD